MILSLWKVFYLKCLDCYFKRKSYTLTSLFCLHFCRLSYHAVHFYPDCLWYSLDAAMCYIVFICPFYHLTGMNSRSKWSVFICDVWLGLAPFNTLLSLPRAVAWLLLLPFYVSYSGLYGGSCLHLCLLLDDIYALFYANKPLFMICTWLVMPCSFFTCRWLVFPELTLVLFRSFWAGEDFLFPKTSYCNRIRLKVTDFAHIGYDNLPKQFFTLLGFPNFQKKYKTCI